MCSPWYNCNGWLGVKHQLTYSNMCNVTGLGGVLGGGGGGGRKQVGGGGEREWDKSEKDWAILTGLIKAQSVSTQSEHFEMGGGGGGGRVRQASFLQQMLLEQNASEKKDDECWPFPQMHA